MKTVVILTLTSLVLVGCVAPTSQPIQSIDLPPMPTEIRSARIIRSDVHAVEPQILSLAAPTAPLPPLPTANTVATLISMTFEDQPTQQTVIRFNCPAYGFGIAYSENLVDWTRIGEAHWNQPVEDNPFLAIGSTHHRIWLNTAQWQVTHRPGRAGNQWSIELIDPTPRTAAKFYMVYPVTAITGLPK